MDLRRYVVDAVVIEGRSTREVARSHGVSKSWVAELVCRYRSGGYEAIAPRSKAPHHIAHRIPLEVENRIISWRKRLAEDGLDAGAQTIHYHLGTEPGEVPSVSTIWRVLRRRGFVTPQPHKRPRSSWRRFEAQLPNECWQSDVTSWWLADGGEVEIANVLDDHSRLCVGSRAYRSVKATDVVEALRSAGERWGWPSRLLTDNGCIYTTWHRGGPNVVQTELLARGIAFTHSRPYHPQTCGKVERFHQTLKAFLAKQPRAASIAELQAQIDRFVAYYNEVRPHRACGRGTPLKRWQARDRARPSGRPIEIGAGMRVRSDRVSRSGNVTLRHRTRLHHIGVGKDHVGTRVIMLVDDLDVRILTEHGEMLRHLTLDPTKDYQATGRPPGPPKGRYAKRRR